MVNRVVVGIIVGVFVLLLLLLILSLYRGWNDTSGATSTVIPLTSPVGMGYRCADYTCSEGLACDSVLQQCRLVNGQRCSRASECLNGAYCSGVCVNEFPGVETGLSGAPCPCGTGMTCVEDPGGSGRRYCLRNAGNLCSSNSECLSSLCTNGLCSAGKAAGEVCTSNSECTQANCSLGYCQPPSVITAEEGAYCRVPGPPSCNSGMVCELGKCRRVTQGLGEACDNELTCMEPLTCYYSENMQLCSPGVTACECNYNYNLQLETSRPDPNACNLSGQCSSGYTCQDGRCLGVEGSPCIRGSECLFNCIDNGGGIFALVFETLDEQLQPTLAGTSPDYIQGSYSVRYIKISSGEVPSGVADITGYTIAPQTSTNTTTTTTTAPVYPTAPQLASQVMLYYLVPGQRETPTTSGLIGMDGRNVIAGWSSSTLIQGDLTTVDERLLVWAVVQDAGTSLVVFQQQLTYITSSGEVDLVNQVSGDTIYFYNPTSKSLQPLDSGGDLPGLQFLQDGSPLTISRVTLSSRGDIVVQDRAKVLYVRPAGATRYSRLVSSLTSSPLPAGLLMPKYYNGLGTTSTTPSSQIPCYGNCPSYLDVSYVGYLQNYQSTEPPYLGLLLQFNGNAEGAIFPLLQGASDTYNVECYSTYSETEQGITGGYLALISTNVTNARTSMMVAPNGRLSVLPGYVSAGSLVLSLKSGIYLYASGICS